MLSVKIGQEIFRVFKIDSQTDRECENGILKKIRNEIEESDDSAVRIFINSMAYRRISDQDDLLDICILLGRFNTILKLESHLLFLEKMMNIVTAQTCNILSLVTSMDGCQIVANRIENIFNDEFTVLELVYLHLSNLVDANSVGLFLSFENHYWSKDMCNLSRFIASEGSYTINECINSSSRPEKDRVLDVLNCSNPHSHKIGYDIDGVYGTVSLNNLDMFFGDIVKLNFCREVSNFATKRLYIQDPQLENFCLSAKKCIAFRFGQKILDHKLFLDIFLIFKNRDACPKIQKDKRNHISSIISETLNLMFGDDIEYGNHCRLSKQCYLKYEGEKITFAEGNVSSRFFQNLISRIHAISRLDFVIFFEGYDLKKIVFADTVNECLRIFKERVLDLSKCKAFVDICGSIFMPDDLSRTLFIPSNFFNHHINSVVTAYSILNLTRTANFHGRSFQKEKGSNMFSSVINGILKLNFYNPTVPKTVPKEIYKSHIPVNVIYKAFDNFYGMHCISKVYANRAEASSKLIEKTINLLEKTKYNHTDLRFEINTGPHNLPFFDAILNSMLKNAKLYSCEISKLLDCIKTILALLRQLESQAGEYNFNLLYRNLSNSFFLTEYLLSGKEKSSFLSKSCDLIIQNHLKSLEDLEVRLVNIPESPLSECFALANKLLNSSLVRNIHYKNMSSLSTIVQKFHTFLTKDTIYGKFEYLVDVFLTDYRSLYSYKLPETMEEERVLEDVKYRISVREIVESYLLNEKSVLDNKISKCIIQMILKAHDLSSIELVRYFARAFLKKNLKIFYKQMYRPQKSHLAYIDYSEYTISDSEVESRKVLIKNHIRRTIAERKKMLTSKSERVLLYFATDCVSELVSYDIVNGILASTSFPFYIAYSIQRIKSLRRNLKTIFSDESKAMVQQHILDLYSRFKAEELSIYNIINFVLFLNANNFEITNQVAIENIDLLLQYSIKGKHVKNSKDFYETLYLNQVPDFDFSSHPELIFMHWNLLPDPTMPNQLRNMLRRHLGIEADGVLDSEDSNSLIIVEHLIPIAPREELMASSKRRRRNKESAKQNFEDIVELEDSDLIVLPDDYQDKTVEPVNVLEQHMESLIENESTGASLIEANPLFEFNALKGYSLTILGETFLSTFRKYSRKSFYFYEPYKRIHCRTNGISLRVFEEFLDVAQDMGLIRRVGKKKLKLLN